MPAKIRVCQTRRRRGSIVVLSALFMIGVFALLALTVDLGYIYTAESELQRSADAAAVAGANKLLEQAMASSAGTVTTQYVSASRTVTESYAALNAVRNVNPNLSTENVTIGYLVDPTNSDAAINSANVSQANAVRAIVERTAEQNGELRLFFGPLLSRSSVSIRGDATAAFDNNFRGFHSPGNGSGNLDLLPFALDQTTWNNLMAGTGTDTWKYNATTGTVSAGADGIKECNLYPQGTGSPGNRGTVDIGGSNNSTADIARQIVEGVSPEDLEHHDGELAFDENGELELNGDTGISAGVKDELNSIRGQPRIIPVFASVTGPGNNAQYTIVKFVGIRIMEVVLTGKMSSKRVIIQPAPIVVRGGVRSDGLTVQSHMIYSPVRLVR